jgi:hypothetical protein
MKSLIFEKSIIKMNRKSIHPPSFFNFLNVLQNN